MLLPLLTSGEESTTSLGLTCRPLFTNDLNTKLASLTRFLNKKTWIFYITFRKMMIACEAFASGSKPGWESPAGCCTSEMSRDLMPSPVFPKKLQQSSFRPRRVEEKGTAFLSSPVYDYPFVFALQKKLGDSEWKELIITCEVMFVTPRQWLCSVDEHKCLAGPSHATAISDNAFAPWSNLLLSFGKLGQKHVRVQLLIIKNACFQENNACIWSRIPDDNIHICIEMFFQLQLKSYCRT